MKEHLTAARALDPGGTASMRLRSLCVALALSFAGLPALSANSQVKIPLTVAKGVALRVKLQNRVRIKNAGAPVYGRLADPVYVYDRAVAPAGAEVLGRVTQVRGVSKVVRARAIMNGRFTPLRTADVEFDALVLNDGTRIPISTEVAPAAGPVIHLVSSGNDPSPGLIAEGRQEVVAEKNRVVSAISKPGKIARLKKEVKTLAESKIPYHRQYLQPGTVFTAELEAPLSFGVETLPASELARLGSVLPPDSILHARLVTALNSATAHHGATVTAIVTTPVFSPNGQLIIPQGSRLEGVVEQAKAARWLHRNGKLRFTFQRIEIPGARPEIIHGSIEGAEVPEGSGLKIDAEGGVQPKTSKAKYVAPALSLFFAVQAATPDRDAAPRGFGGAVPGQGGVTGKVVAGGWGFGLVGSALSLAVKSRAVAASLGFYGAALSIYGNLLARGREVQFPANTPIEIQLGSHRKPGSRAPLPADAHN